ERHHRPDVFDALAEALEGRARQPPATAADRAVAPVVELEVADADRVEPRRDLADQRLAGEERRPEAVYPDERGAPATAWLCEGTRCPPCSPEICRCPTVRPCASSSWARS